MKWKKLGRVFEIEERKKWSWSHAQLPVADVMGERIRVYYSTRDKKNMSRPSYFEVSANNPRQVVYEHQRPLMQLGKTGTFDDCGVMPSWVATDGRRKYMYYVGWNRRINTPYQNSVGLAISDDGGEIFERISEGPLWGRNMVDPYFCGTMCVLKEKGLWRGWYMSSTGWIEYRQKKEPKYLIKYAESRDGIVWKREGVVAVDYKSEDEGGIVKASVIKVKGKYLMWYSYRKETRYRINRARGYRIGWAESKDGLKWKRMDEKVGIQLSASGWDAKMQCYPHVIKVGKKWLMFYNGNGFGQSGIGIAEAKL